MKPDKKTLYLVRHAKAVKFAASGSDIDRCLHEEGYAEAYRIAAELLKNREIPELIITSPAVRAFSTAMIYQRTLGVPDSNVQIKEAIYEADVNEMYELVAALNDKYDAVMLVGHNPSFSLLAQKMDASILHIPTGGVVRLDFEVNKWKHSSYINADLRFFTYP